MGTTIVVMISIIIGIITYNIVNFFQNYNKVFLNNSELKKSGGYVYTLDKKVDAIYANVNTLSSIDNTHIKVYSGNLVLNDVTIKEDKNWKIETALISGTNIVEIDILFKDGQQINQIFYIFNTNDENLKNLDSNDNDNDGIVNYQEDIVGTSKNKKDTDGDGISDYDEIYYTLTDPTKMDTDSNGVSDADEDFDADGLSNLEEIEYKTNVNIADSDEDGILDYDEVKTYGTNPNNSDSDSDGLDDKLEITYGINPNEENNDINATKNSEDNKASVIMERITGQQYASLKVEKVNNSIINSDFEAYISGPYNFSIDGNINSATIKLEFETNELNRNSIPTIYYYNTNNQELEEVTTYIDGSTAYAKVEHFSQYCLLDKNIVDSKINNAPKKDGSNVSKASLSDNEYIIISFPMFNFFGMPVYIFKVTDNEEDLNQVETVLETASGNIFDIVCSTISKIGAQFFDAIFSWLSNETMNMIEAQGGEEYDNFFQNLVLYRHIYGSKALEEYILGESKDLIQDTGSVSEEKDTNNDGISDYFTKLICNGQLTTKLGTNPFGEVSYSEIQKNRDYDNDGLNNGEEIQIIEENGAYYIMENSSPVLSDSDGDTVDDKHDASPLQKFDERFLSVDNLEYVPPTPAEDAFEQESIRVYNSVDGDYGTSLTRAKIMVGMFGKMHAALALGHFLDNTGTTYNFDNDWGLIETFRGKENLAKNTNSLMQVVEETVKNNEKLCFASNTELTGTNFSEHLDDLIDIGWWYAVGYTRATMTAEAKNIDGDNYKMILHYNIVDYYDWDGDANFISGFGGLVNDAEMYRLHTYGVAQQYRININYKMEITWKKGDRYKANIMSYDTPESMTITKLD